MSNQTQIFIEEQLAKLNYVRSVVVNEMNQRVQVVFSTDMSEARMQQRMTAILCAVKIGMPDGYSLRLGGKHVKTDMTVVTAVVSAGKIAAVNCADKVDWLALADEYNPAKKYLFVKPERRK